MAAPMSFALHTEPCPQLAELGDVVELREVSHLEVKRALRHEPSEDVAEALLGASLYVDGEPFGFEALEAAPGHLTMAITEAAGRAWDIHGLSRPRSAPVEPAAEDDAPGEA